MNYRINLENPELIERQVVKQLRDRVVSHSFEPEQPLPSFSDFANMFSVSKATVQKAMGQLKREGLIITRVGKGTFVRAVKPAGSEPPARTGRSQSKTLNLAAICFDVWGRLDDFLSPFLEGISEVCQAGKHNFQLHCIHGTTLESKENRLIHRLVYNNDVDGVLILSPIDSRDFRSLRRQRIPFVLAGPAAYGLSVNVVRLNPQATIRLFVNACLARGKRRLALVTGPRQDAMVRVKLSSEILNNHFRKILKEHNLPYHHRYVKEGAYSEDAGYRCVRELLGMTNPPDAILIIGNAMTRGALAAKAEIKTPTSLSGAANNVLLVSCAERNLRLTPLTILHPIDALAKHATSLLIDIIQGRRKLYKNHVIELSPILDVQKNSPVTVQNCKQAPNGKSYRGNNANYPKLNFKQGHIHATNI